MGGVGGGVITSCQVRWMMLNPGRCCLVGRCCYVASFVVVYRTGGGGGVITSCQVRWMMLNPGRCCLVGRCCYVASFVVVYRCCGTSKDRRPTVHRGRFLVFTLRSGTRAISRRSFALVPLPPKVASKYKAPGPESFEETVHHAAKKLDPKRHVAAADGSPSLQKLLQHLGLHQLKVLLTGSIFSHPWVPFPNET